MMQASLFLRIQFHIVHLLAMQIRLHIASIYFSRLKIECDVVAKQNLFKNSDSRDLRTLRNFVSDSLNRMIA